MWNSLKTISTLRVCMSRLKEPCWSTHCARPPTFLDALLTCCCVCVSYALSARSLKTTCTANTWVLRYPATTCSLRCSMPSAAGHEDSEALWWSTLIYGSIKLWCMSKTMRLSWVFPFFARTQPIYLLSILSDDIGSSQIHLYWCICCPIYHMKTFDRF